MKRLLAPMLLAALAGESPWASSFCSSARQAPARVDGDQTVSARGPTGARREASSTAPTATQIYQRDSTGVVAIKAVTAEGEDEGTGIVLNNKA